MDFTARGNLRFRAYACSRRSTARPRVPIGANRQTGLIRPTKPVLLQACTVASLYCCKPVLLQACTVASLSACILFVMWVVTLASQKGGSGKTTLACSLAVVASESGQRVAVADADPQASALAWYERRNTFLRPDVVGITLRAVHDTVSAAQPQYDLLLLDTPGQLTASNDALALADLALIPCRPTIADADAAPKMYETASRIARSTAFVVTQMPTRGERRAEALESALASLGVVAPARIASRNAYADALALGLGVTEFEPRGKAAAEIRSLWSWMSEQLQELP